MWFMIEGSVFPHLGIEIKRDSPVGRPSWNLTIMGMVLNIIINYQLLISITPGKFSFDRGLK